jgi:hypothetical protein
MEKTGQEQESLISEIQNGACARQEIYSRAWKIFVILVMLGLTSILNFFLKQFIGNVQKCLHGDNSTD